MLNQLDKRILELEDIKKIKPNLDFLKVISKETSEKIQAIIFDWDKKVVYVLTTNNHSNALAALAEKLTLKGYKIEYYYTDETSFYYAMKWYNQLERLEEKTQKELEERQTASGKEALQMIKKLYDERENYNEWEFMEEVIRLAFMAWSSDLHFQSEEIGVVVRIRKDWLLKTILVFEHAEFKKYLVKIKFMSWVKINIDYVPQDWRFDLDITRWWERKKIDVRVSVMPWLRWENIVMRFLDSGKWIMSFTEIWFMWDTLKILQNNINRNFGMIIVTWPTGSWKTTTLYSMLNYLNEPWKKIITLEDPVEYELVWIQQSQMNARKNYTYEEWLKSILRQDPDIIMVWEIRSLETAEIAINAALTWHLVITTLHTNSAVEAISRLLNMWVKPYMLAPAINLIVWQRLVRKLDTCAKFREANMSEKKDVDHMIKTIKQNKPVLKLDFDGKLPNPTWCENCGYDWYRWRLAVVETFEVNDDIRNLILMNKSAIDMVAFARQYGYMTMKEDAYIKLLSWYTTLEEIRRVL